MKRTLCLLAVLALAKAGRTATEEVTYIAAGEVWRYFKGTEAPPSAWKEVSFDDSAWLAGETGIGYGDNDDATVLSDMRNRYVSVYLRRRFQITEPAAVIGLVLDVVYDDGFAAYLNGREVARENLAADARFDTTAGRAGEPTATTVDLTPFLDELTAEDNVLGIEVHNATAGSSDLSMIPVLRGQVLSGLARFTRGDTNSDGSITVSDAVYLLSYLFEDGPSLSCPDTGDGNDDGRLNILDAVYLLARLFIGGPPLAEPHDCGFDFTFEDEDPALAECNYPPCP